MKKLYKVGIYCRLSVEDASNSAKAKNYIPSDESVSIENQQLLLSKFVMLNGWREINTYCDDGYSGGNFQRPGFQKMLEDAKKGIINLILVKDLSRLGRDFVEVGRYTDMVFPSLGCRFVSVLDCLDTENDSTDMLHFRSLMNDYHLKDLSNKVKSVLYSKKQRGEFISAYAPYGYRKSAGDKRKLVIDEEAAAIVRRIFQMRRDGAAYGKIAAALNADGILSPRGRWQSLYGKVACMYSQLWMYATVKNLLHSEVYLGNLVANTTGSRTYKDKTMIYKPEAEWVRREATHEAIITPEEWEAVQEINRASSQRAVGNRKPETHLFTGKLVCADCKSPLGASTATQRREDGAVKRYVTYFCTRFSGSGRSVCSWHSIGELTLKKIVTAEIKAHAQAVELDETAVVKNLKRRMAQYSEQQQADTRQEAGRLRRRVQELEGMTAKLYEDKVSGAISESSFSVLMQKNEQERLAKAERLDALLSEISKAEQTEADIQSWTAIVRKYLHLEALDRNVVDELIDHIEVGERAVVNGQRTRDIKVFYRFVGNIT